VVSASSLAQQARSPRGDACHDTHDLSVGVAQAGSPHDQEVGLDVAFRMTETVVASIAAVETKRGPGRLLFAAPFIAAWRAERRALEWTAKFTEAASWPVEVKMAECPYEDPADGAGYWLFPYARRPEEQRKRLRKQLLNSVVTVLRETARWSPSVVLGQGQGGTVVAAASCPRVAELACRYRAVAADEMRCLRRAWASVAFFVVADPEIVRGSGSYFELTAALPELLISQPRLVPKCLLLSSETRAVAYGTDLALGIGAVMQDMSLSLSGFADILTAPPRLCLESDSEDRGFVSFAARVACCLHAAIVAQACI
jgi:hypothetical protein